MNTKFKVGQTVCAIINFGESKKVFKINSIVINDDGVFYFDSYKDGIFYAKEEFVFPTEEEFKETLKNESKKLHEYIFWR
jgi:hypothetical protein